MRRGGPRIPHPPCPPPAPRRLGQNRRRSFSHPSGHRDENRSTDLAGYDAPRRHLRRARSLSPRGPAHGTADGRNAGSVWRAGMVDRATNTAGIALGGATPKRSIEGLICLPKPALLERGNPRHRSRNGWTNSRPCGSLSTPSHYAAGGGCRGVLGVCGSIQAQLGAESVHIVNDGCACSGSSSVPARRINRCGRASDALVTGVPQFSQNRRCILLPLSARLE